MLFFSCLLLMDIVPYMFSQLQKYGVVHAVIYSFLGAY